MTIFLLGVNGTLGFRIAVLAKKKLNYNLTCLARRNTPEINYLRYYGVRVLYSDIFDMEILFESMFGSNVVIDAATGRAFEKIEESDVNVKLILLRVCEEIKIERFIFFSIVNAEKFKTIPLVQAKLFLEEKIKASKINYTIFRLTGFYEGILQEYVRPLFDKKKIYLTEKVIPISYIDAIDVARLVLRSFTSRKFINKTINIGGIEAWTPQSILYFCETFSTLEPSFHIISSAQILFARFFTTFFEEAWPISRKLALIDIVLQGDKFLVTNPKELFEIFEIEKEELRDLPSFLSFHIEKIIDILLKKFCGNLEDDEKEVEKWKQKGVEVISDISKDDLPDSLGD